MAIKRKKPVWVDNNEEVDAKRNIRNTCEETDWESEDNADGGDDQPGQSVTNPLSWFLCRWNKIQKH